MPETTDPVQQTPAAPVQQSTPTYPAPPPAGFVEQARFTGAIQTIEKLTLEKRDLDAKFAQLTSENERLKGEAVQGDTERTIAVGERDKQLQTLVEQDKAKDNELAELRALKLKMEVAKEIGKPDLIKIADRIPSISDREVLKTVMSDIAGFADDAVRAREKELLAGITPGISGVQPVRSVSPANEKEWTAHINSLPLGTTERAKAFDDYYEWLQKPK
jgi:hypothetical protein